MLYRLIYYSKNLIRKSNNPARSELRRIVTSAGQNNRERGVTGGLMFNKDYFGQVLEGERKTVSELFCRIINDQRHASIVLVEASAVETRIFDRWAMGLAEKSETADKLNAKFGLVRGFDPSSLSAPHFLQYVFEMVSLEEKLISVAVPTWDGVGSTNVCLI